jgi:hypothetical protein
MDAVYLGRNIFGRADVGHYLSSSRLDFGLVARGTRTKSRFETIQIPQMNGIYEE